MLVVLLLLAITTLCSANTTVTIIPNVHLPVTEVRLCRNWIRVDEQYTNRHTTIGAGDSILIIQMKGAWADSNGMLRSMGTAGRFERNVIARRNDDTLFLLNSMLVDYDAGGSTQVVTMASLPQRDSVVSADTTLTYRISALPFDGRAGGVIALHSTDTMNLWCDVNADGIGYRSNEGVCTVGISPNAGKSTSEVGSGGEHGGSGGLARTTNSAPPANGQALSYTSGVNWIFMGGGAGENGGVATNSGGGIIIIDAPALKGHGYSVTTNGNDGITPNQGGGAGGAMLVTCKVIEGLSQFTARGGNCSNGGAGGGGVIRIGTITAMNLSGSSYSGGTASYGKQGNGQEGKLFYNVTINESQRRYTAPVVTVSSDTAVCAGTPVTLRVFGSMALAWTHDADTLCTTCDTVTVTPTTTTRYVAHVAINGCVDTLVCVVTVLHAPPLDLGETIVTCPHEVVTLTAPTNFVKVIWSTGDTTFAIRVENQGVYTVTAFDGNGCVANDSIAVVWRNEERMRAEGLAASEAFRLNGVQPYERSVGSVTVRNVSATPVLIKQVEMTDNTVLSAPISQFPITIAPFNTNTITLVAESSVPGVFADSMTIIEQCGLLTVPVVVNVYETPWYSRCGVRVTSAGELEQLLRDVPEAVIVDLLGRPTQLPLCAGLYLIRTESSRYVVQMP